MHLMQSHYEINIAQKGKHFAKVYLAFDFAEVASRKFEEFRDRFPVAEGWNLEMTEWRGSGTVVAKSRVEG